MTDTPATQPAKAPEAAIPHIGAFVLETLTLGMYGEPRHTLREYVQNAFDSIQLALRNEWMTARGRVDVTLSADEISIRDNGTGIPQSQAWGTLTSIGASKKDRQRDAGFRGIGRLAGMAYCDKLIFRTRFSGEDKISRVSFDCLKLMTAMSPDEGGEVELAKLLRDSITDELENIDATTPAHFFEVIMKGLTNASPKLTSPEDICNYLSETSPVSYSPNWTRAAEIEKGFTDYFGTPPQTIDLYVTVGGKEIQIFKPYGETYEHAKGQVALKDIQFERGPDSSYWGWIGHLTEVAAVTDDRCRGLRARVRNIQVDGTEVFQELFTVASPSYGRLSNYYVGEFHINPKQVVPNARRDGFEETKHWIWLKNYIAEEVCHPLAKAVYSASSEQQIDIAKILEQIEKLDTRTAGLVESSRATYDQVVDVMTSAKRLRKRAVTALKTAQDAVAADGEEPVVRQSLRAAVQTVEGLEGQATALLGKVVEDDDKTKDLRARIREELLRQMLDVVKNFVDPSTFQRIRRELAPR